jgi:hypothetical protein
MDTLNMLPPEPALEIGRPSIMGLPPPFLIATVMLRFTNGLMPI